jgi:hypothetical protein
MAIDIHITAFSTSPSPLVAGAQGGLNFTFVNNGTDTPSGDEAVTIKVTSADGTTVDEGDLTASLDPGATKDSTFTFYPPSAGEYKVTATPEAGQPYNGNFTVA